MIERGAGGRVINVTSIDALHPSSVGLAPCDASKHGAWDFTENWRSSSPPTTSGATRSRRAGS